LATALEAAGLIQDAARRDPILAEIAELQAIATSMNNHAAVNPLSAARATSHPTKMTTDYWLGRLDDASTDAICALGTDPFLDLTHSLKSLAPSEDPAVVFGRMGAIANTVMRAQIAIDNIVPRHNSVRL
jgi:hypothetical protein